MRPEIKLFFDFEFTSLSPDAQPISLGIVSEELCGKCYDKKLNPDEDCENCSGEWHKGLNRSSFYAEFSDFDINRCDDWVKENVVGKLTIKDFVTAEEMVYNEEKGNVRHYGDTNVIRYYLEHWLTQFSDYNIQFVCDCGTFDWYWMLQLLAEWDEKQIEDWSINPPLKQEGFDISVYLPKIKTGLPKLPENISPVPQDLNDLIALKKGISIREAFELNREELVGSWDELEEIGQTGKVFNLDQFPKHNSLFDAKVIKAVYEKLS